MLAAEGFDWIPFDLRTGHQLTMKSGEKYAIASREIWPMRVFTSMMYPGNRITRFTVRARKLAGNRESRSYSDWLPAADYRDWKRKTGQQEVSEISRQLWPLGCGEPKVPVIALWQLSRGVEQRQDKRPVLSIFVNSGSIERDVTYCCFLCTRWWLLWSSW